MSYLSFIKSNYFLISNSIAAVAAVISLINDPENKDIYIPDFIAHITNAVAFKFKDNSTLKTAADVTNLVRLGFLAKSGMDGNYGTVELTDTLVHGANIFATHSN